MYLVFTRMPGKSYCRWFRSLLLCLYSIFWTLINSLVCWFCTSALGLVLFQWGREWPSLDWARSLSLAYNGMMSGLCLVLTEMGLCVVVVTPIWQLGFFLTCPNSSNITHTTGCNLIQFSQHPPAISHTPQGVTQYNSHSTLQQYHTHHRV